ncbi:MAG: zf-HC2 domain-containing protein [Acidobacteria bacterium]|nr:zf-HC2 domain-containing protein [Acidobacteriota bacterium]
MSEHESVRKLLALAAAGALEFEDVRRVEQHAQACDDCRRELETWSRYARALRQLPQPSLPAGLLERARDRILQENGAATSDQANAVLLGAIVVFGWVSAPALWVLVHGVTGGTVNIQGMSLVSLLWWSLLSAVLTWTTAAASAMALVRRSERRSIL